MAIHDPEDKTSLSQKRSVVVSRSLHKSTKFKSLFDQLGFRIQARTATIEALMKISAEYELQCYANKVAAARAFLENTNSITFTDEDMEVTYFNHRQPLYLEAWINDVHIRRALFDTGSSINIVPLAVLTAAKIQLKRSSSPRFKSPDLGTKAKYA